MLFQAKQALVFKAMYQSAFLAREKRLNFDDWLSDFIHSFYFAFNKKYNNSIQKYIKDNIQYCN